MSRNEVQANSVIYSRKDYIKLLEDAQRAFSKLQQLRQVQIDEWKADTEARELDLERMLSARYTSYYWFPYKSYVEKLSESVELPWWKKLLGIKPVKRVDEYGSAVAYTSKKEGTDFEEYKAKEIEHAIPLYGDRVEILRWFAANSNEFMENEWDDVLEGITQTLKEVDYDTTEVQFVIPRGHFDKYTDAMLTADSGQIEPVEGRLYPKRGFCDWDL